jgi:hypothetical protein
MNGDRQIILEGRVTDGFDGTEALHEFWRLTGQPVARVEGRCGDQPTTMTRNIDQSTAGRFARALNQSGAPCCIETFAPTHL